MDGGLPSQQVLLTTLATVVCSGPLSQLRSPAVIVIRAVAGFSDGHGPSDSVAFDGVLQA